MDTLSLRSLVPKRYIQEQIRNIQTITMAKKFDDAFEDYYAALGVFPSASPDEIRQAYVERIKDVHPDRFQQASDAERRDVEETSRLLNRAKDTLLNPTQRQRYDERYRARYSNESNELDSQDDVETKRYFYRKDRLGAFSGARGFGFLVITISTIYILGASMGLVGRALMTKGVVKIAEAKQTVELSLPSYEWRTAFPVQGFGITEDAGTATLFSLTQQTIYRRTLPQNDEAPFAAKGSVEKFVLAKDKLAVVTDSSIVVYSLDGRALATLNGHRGKITCLAFSPDGVHLCSASEDRTIKIWNVRNRAAERTFAASNKAVESVAFSPDGIHVAFNDDRWLKLWSWRDGRVRQLAQHRDKILHVACSNEWAASASLGGELKQTHRITGAVKNVAQESGVITALAYSPDGRWLASSNADGRARLYTASSARLAQTIEAHHGKVSSIQFSDAGDRLYTAGADSAIKSWKLPNDTIKTVIN